MDESVRLECIPLECIPLESALVSLFGTVQSTLLPAEGSEVAGVVTSLPYWFQNHCLVTSQNVNSHNTNSLNTNS